MIITSITLDSAHPDPADAAPGFQGRTHFEAPYTFSIADGCLYVKDTGTVEAPGSGRVLAVPLSKVTRMRGT